MKANVVRKMAELHALEALEAAIESISENELEILDCEGEDMGERLTHLLLAARIRRRTDAGEPLKDAFRAEMASVRETLQNE